MQLVHSRNGRLTALVASFALALGVAAAPASAQTTQSGLVNVAVVDNTVQVPIAVAANVCGLQVGVLASALRQGPLTCNATTTAPPPAPAGGAAGPPPPHAPPRRPPPAALADPRPRTAS